MILLAPLPIAVHMYVSRKIEWNRECSFIPEMVGLVEENEPQAA